MAFFHVVVICEKSGRKVTMTRTPVTHKEGCTILSKLTRYDWRRNQLEAVSMFNEAEKQRILADVALELSELKKLGVRVVELTEERKATALEFYHGGMTISEIVDALIMCG